MLSCGAKRLFKNYMKHVEIHNRMIEKAKTCRQKELRDPRAMEPFFKQDGKADVKDEFPSQGRKARLDNEKDTCWNKQKAGGIDSDRWDHSGYKELYPEEFYSDEGHHKNHSDVTTKHRSNDRHKEKKVKKSKRKKRHSKCILSDAETDTTKSNPPSKIIEKAKTCRQKEPRDPRALEPFFKQDGKTDVKDEFPSKGRKARLDNEKYTCWNKQKAGGIDSDRWDHSGYKELYPEEFYSNEGHHKNHSYETTKHRSKDIQKEGSQKHKKRRKGTKNSAHQTRKQI